MILFQTILAALGPIILGLAVGYFLANTAS